MAKKFGIWMSGTKKVVAALQEKTLKGGKVIRYDVVFTAPYAIFVHENMLIYHKNGQAKYLETVVRTRSNEVNDVITKNRDNKESLDTSVFRAAKFVLEEAKKLVPVDTGFLRDSGTIKKG